MLAVNTTRVTVLEAALKASADHERQLQGALAGAHMDIVIANAQQSTNQMRIKALWQLQQFWARLATARSSRTALQNRPLINGVCGRALESVLVWRSRMQGDDEVEVKMAFKQAVEDEALKGEREGMILVLEAAAEREDALELKVRCN